ncbi:hypothetical protein [Tepidiforma sp.]|uniref:hypothetical protein n=1 Tax=Tepidiforma sp. TaxID=2682230 RepID=UPI002ADE3D69|nr:hypothetical protein [Tepidiforma sp.]
MRHAGPWLLAGALIAACVFSVRLRLEGTAEFADPGWDRHYYLEAARVGPWDFHIAPYCWRVLVPTAAWLAPPPEQVTFFAIAAAGAVIFGATLWLLLREAGLSAAQTAAGVLLAFGLGWGLRYQLADFWLPDAAAGACIVLAMRFAHRGRAVLFALTLLAGALLKEVTLAAAPLALTLWPGQAPLCERLLRAGAAVAPAAAATVAVRLAIPAWNDDAAYLASLPPVISRFPEVVANYDYAVLLREIGWEERIRGFDGDLAQALTVRSFGSVLLVLATAGALARPGRAARLAPFVLLVFAQLLIARDTERLMAFASPAMAWLAAEGAAALEGRGWLMGGEALLLAAGAFALALVRGPSDFATDPAAEFWLLGAVAAALAARRLAVSLRG